MQERARTSSASRWRALPASSSPTCPTRAVRRRAGPLGGNRGHLQMISNMLAHVQAGSLRALATRPAAQRLLPDVPTVREAGYPDAGSPRMVRIFAPARTPHPSSRRCIQLSRSAQD